MSRRWPRPSSCPPGAFDQPVDQTAAVQAAECFEGPADRYFGGGLLPLSVGGPDESEHWFAGGADFCLEEPFVDVADLLDVEGPEGEAPALAGYLDVLDGAQHPEHGPVVDFWGTAGI
ncbi:MAG: hypothetical protein ACRDWW_06645 [Acidimicrobiales bacterium]